MTTKTVTVPNISCGHCVRTIEREVSELAGVTSVSADPVSKQVQVAWDESATEWSTVESLLREINYPPAG
jgi:copper chaperone CopZ